MKLVRSVPIILVIILALTAFDSPRAAAQTDCARTPIDMPTMIGSWSSASDCHSPNRPIDPEGRGDGIYYAVYYDFHVSRTSEVTITLESSTDTYLYLLTGAGRNGEFIDKNDDINYDTRNLNSRITKTLEPGNYSIEATTYAKEATGDFTLTIDGIDFATPADADRAALIALYNATDGPNWHRNAHWLTDAPLNYWHGVYTDDSGRVVVLDLSSNNLSGEIPSELGNLASLGSLQLGGNRLTSEIPTHLGNLRELEWLNLGNNQLTGEIPLSLTNLTNLFDFIFHLNAGLCAPDDATFQQWLRTVPQVSGPTCDLAGIRAKHAVLTAFYNATDGDNWHRDDNWLTDAPLHDWYGVSVELDGKGIGLSLVHNNLSGYIPPELGSLSEMKDLFLDNNNLTGSIPPELGKLSNLKGMFLNGNDLTGEIPAELANLDSLAYLELAGNRLTGHIPSELGSMTYLRELSLSSNQLTGTIPAELANLDLLSLYLSGNQLTGCIPDALRDVIHNDFDDLNLPFCENPDRAALIALYNATDGDNWYRNDNWLTDAPMSEWHGVETDSDGRVSELELEGNNLTGAIPSELGNLTNLAYLELEGNKFTGAIPPELGNLINLLALSFDANNLTGSIPPELSNMASLEQLHLAGNELTGDIPSSLGNLSNLSSLALSRNRLTGIVPAELGNLIALNRLYLEDNQLTGELPSELTQLDNLNLLYFDNNDGLCAPADTAFQTWLQSITRVDGDTCEEDTTVTPEPDPQPPSSECTQSISARAPAQGQWTSNCVSTNRTEHGEYYAKYFTFTLDRPTTVEVLLESRTDSYILLLDSDGETVTQNDDYIYRNAGFLTALKPGEYTIEATTYSTQESGDFTLTVKQPELDALHALYNATDGANWDDSDNWLTGAPLSDWHGVKTDEDGRVIEIYLIGNNLSGEIPRELGDLGELQWLFLSRNGLSGSIPQELGNLYNLKILMLSNNELSGSIPARLGNMAALEELHLGRNRLSGRIPASLGRLENLRKLSLTVNDLSGSIPAELANLSDLRTLSIAANDLGGPIPYQLTDLENLTHIYLWGNDLSEGSFVRYLGDLESLQFLDIGGNDIDGAEVLAELDGLPNLTGLGLHDSDLTDADLLRYMDDLQALNLEFINLSGNRLSDLQILVGLSRITTLQRIAINDNDFSGELPRTMTRLTLMRLFYFHDNDGLCAPDDSEFQDWLQGSPEIREFLRGGYPDVKGPTCTSGTTPANAPAPTSNGADQFAAVLQTPEQLVPPHSLSLLESIQPGG